MVIKEVVSPTGRKRHYADLRYPPLTRITYHVLCSSTYGTEREHHPSLDWYSIPVCKNCVRIRETLTESKASTPYEMALQWADTHENETLAHAYIAGFEEARR